MQTTIIFDASEFGPTNTSNSFGELLCDMDNVVNGAYMSFIAMINWRQLNHIQRDV